MKAKPRTSRSTAKAVRVPRGAGRGPACTPASLGHPTPRAFPIVGIGASAGGLEALLDFLGRVPQKSGLAYVIVQHLDPTNEGMLPELLQRGTSMPVVQVKDRMRVEPDRVYVIPPNRDMSILHGVLHLFPLQSPRGIRLPIDFFLRALAEDQRECAVGIILSGMGTDGSLGVKAIKEMAGLVAVQDPRTAKFDSMPRSAIETGVVDLVGPPAELCVQSIAFLTHVPPRRADPTKVSHKEAGALEKAIILLRSHGHDFSLYKRTTLYRRIERRKGIHRLTRIADYVRFLRENPDEIELLSKELLIGVTRFFRDVPAWEKLTTEILPALLADRADGSTIRAWIPGCSTGEEAYTAAIAFKEALAAQKPRKRFKFQIFATDLDPEAIGRARQAVYPPNVAADVTPERLRRFFVSEESGVGDELTNRWRVGPEIREIVTSAPHNVLTDPPFTRLDLIVCRNLLIYLEPEAQKRLLPMFHFSLNPSGVLFLGSAETVGGLGDLFATLDAKWRIYRRTESAGRARATNIPISSLRDGAGAAKRATRPPVSLQALADQAMLRRFSPPTVLVNAAGDILYVSGRTGKYLEPAAGRGNLNVFAMAREGLGQALSSALHRAGRTTEAVVLPNLNVKTNGHFQRVDLTVHALAEPVELSGMFLVAFADAVEKPERSPGRRPEGGKGTRRDRIDHAPLSAEHEIEAQTLREEARISREEFQVSQEELRSVNEEFQSSNEELVTSKEEMQSLNEELHTVNSELQSKVDQLIQTSDDMTNLLNSTEIATLFLDDALKVRRFTPHAARIMRLLPGDVDRPITDITSDLVYPALIDDVYEVLRTSTARDRQVPTNDGRWFETRVMLYRTLANSIDGVVITFTDITKSKRLEDELRDLRGAREGAADGGLR